jgi:DNA-binding IclR family transcriptional regulator
MAAKTRKRAESRPLKLQKRSRSGGELAASGREDGVKSLHLGLDVLELLVNAGSDKGVTQIADQLGTTKARTFRLLQTLVDRGYVVQDVSSARYSPSIRLFALGQAVGDRFDFAGAIKPEAERLWDKLGHTVVTASFYRGRMLILDVLRGRTPISVGLKVGASLDLHSSAQGRLALAFGPRELLEKVTERSLTAHTPKTIVDPGELESLVRQIRLTGWASAPDQLVIGMNAVAAPVFQHDGSLAGTLAICGLTQFVPEPPTAELIEELTTATWRAARRLGWSGKINPVSLSPARAG